MILKWYPAARNSTGAVQGCSRLKPCELRPLFKIAEREQLEQERILLVEDEHNDRLYVLLEGRCTVRKHGREIAGLGPANSWASSAFSATKRSAQT